MSDNVETRKRNVRTPAQQAKDALNAANERVARAEKARDVAAAASRQAQAEYDRVRVLADYAAKHPDLPQQ